jgi:TolA-binding protein
MEDPIYVYLSLLLAPISSAVTWWASRRKRRNDETNDMQSTIERLMKRQSEIADEVIRLQRDNIRLQMEVARLMSILTAEQLLQYQQLKRNDNE